MLTDEQLIEQLKKGETDALDELYRRYSKKLYAFCYNIARSQNPEDLVQDVFMRVIESAKSFNHRKSSFGTWIFRIARNRCIDLIRREGKIKFTSREEKMGQDNGEEGFTQEDTVVDRRVNVEETVVKASMIEAMRECIGEIRDEEEKHAILLYYISGKVYREIGAILGKSTSMARNLVKSAQEKVKRCLERKGIDSFLY
jgi:RNA polymerase sigma-70 factor (ECF subfamily)